MSRGLTRLLRLLTLCTIVSWPHCTAARLVPVGARFQVNTYTPGDQRHPQVVALPDGGFVIVWQGPPEEYSNLSAYGRRYDANAAPVGSEFRLEGVFGRPAIGIQGDSLVVAPLVLAPTGPGLTVGYFGLDGALRDSRVVTDSDILGGLALATTPQGELGVIWDEFTDTPILGRRFRTDAEPAGPSFVVAEWDEGNKYPHGPRVAAGPDGSFVVVWWAEWSSALLGQRIDPEDRPLGERFPVGAKPGSLGDLGALEICADEASGQFVVAWQEGYTPEQFRRHSADAEPLSQPLCTGGGHVLSCLSEGRFAAVGGVAVRRRSPFVMARTFDGQNRLIGHAQVSVRPFLGGVRATTTTVAALGDDTFVLVWHECIEEDEPGCDVFGQRFALVPGTDCSGDCNGDGRVSIDELVTAVGMALCGEAGVAECPAIETGTDCLVSVSELVAAVNNARRGCE